MQIYDNELKILYIPTRMKICTKPLASIVFIILFESTAFGQFSSRMMRSSELIFDDQSYVQTSYKKAWNLPGFVSDKPSVYKPKNTFMTLPVNSTALLGNSYWMGSVTTQSYNQGKIGRYYFWDIQGNLRGSHLFVDIAGKNKRGLKLVFPRHRFSF